MVVIRLARVGAKHEPRYRIAVADSRRYVTGKFIEIIGSYVPSPSGKQQKVILDVEKAKSWITKGAQPTDTARHVLKLGGVELKARKKSPSKTKNKKAEAKA
jgi:small subunit ribosomal protein S16